jgi:hypothetical protein
MREVLPSVPLLDLRTLPASIRSGRLTAPYSAQMSLASLEGQFAASVSMSLQAMADVENATHCNCVSLGIADCGTV